MIPVCEPVLGEEEIANVNECLRTGWISSAGRFIDEFEESWARACGVGHGIAVSNGSVALDVAVQCLGIGPGDEVIMPTFTIISCAAAIVRVGAIPVLVDSEPRTWGMDVAGIEARITPRTRAIMVVHIYGHPVDMDPICLLARRYNLRIIEDAAEAHGAEYLASRGTPGEAWRRCGQFGDVATFSFYANKLVTTGEGGMVVTNDENLAARARSIRNLCFLPQQRFLHEELGFNFRLTNLQAAIGVAQVRRLDDVVRRKRHIAQAYTSLLGKVDQLELPVEEEWGRSVYWVYGLVLRDSVPFDAVQLARILREKGIETRPFFLGMHEQPVLLKQGLFAGQDREFPVAHRIARRGLYVPAGVSITDDQIAMVASAVERSVCGG